MGNLGLEDIPELGPKNHDCLQENCGGRRRKSAADLGIARFVYFCLAFYLFAGVASARDTTIDADETVIRWTKAEVESITTKNVLSETMPLAFYWGSHVKAQIGGDPFDNMKAIAAHAVIRQWLPLLQYGAEGKVELGNGDGSENVIFVLTEDVYGLPSSAHRFHSDVCGALGRTLGALQNVEPIITQAKARGLPCYGGVGLLHATSIDQYIAAQLIWVIDASASLSTIEHCAALAIGQAAGATGRIKTS
jgi:hypothetical protein